MPVSSRALVELVLLGPTNDRRQLQDSPVLGDVWVAYAVKPAAAIDLLITPHKSAPAGPVAKVIADRIRALKMKRSKTEESKIAYLQGLVAAKLFFEELLKVIVPMTEWWNDPKIQKQLQTYVKGGQLTKKIQAIINWARAETDEDPTTLPADDFATFTALDRYISLAGIILWAATENKANNLSLGAGDALLKLETPDPVVQGLHDIFEAILTPKRSTAKVSPQIWQISLNRKALPALDRSVPSVKGDAARTLFNVNCRKINWAVFDSGIDGSHPVFNDNNGDSRIIKSFDFSNIREIVSLDNDNPKTPEFKERLKSLLKASLKNPITAKQATENLQELAEDAANDRPIHWELVEPLIEIKSDTDPKGGHGTHVAGIIGANSGKNSNNKKKVSTSFADGMCPDINFYDFRVLAKTLEDTEFAIIAALQYLRYLNDRHTYLTIHGANLSLSIPHDVRNFACGRTPICNECERLVESGVVVVAAAGNLGYQSFETKDGSFESYTAFSITDPGNADGVITVGATHRFRPHTYGVSFFSSRGPTGDGRLKPDLVAPGERIESCLPKGEWGELDGTSMAAPHVSGAAAMLMARYDELIGAPRRIKRILCESATDLGRERSFQGHGMLDVLRAFQTI
ncbi:MAG TPA: S8 family peptidase [Pyrinomonadaceae bacterium]|nr:S8 family peptidase [Pyrinomonadaceae bacterium]